jgi:hypothetical protein
MGNQTTMFKALDALTAQEAKLNYNPWASFDKIQEQAAMAERLAGAVVYPRSIGPTLPDIGVTGMIDPEIFSRALRPYTHESSMAKAAEQLRGSTALSSYMAAQGGAPTAAKLLKDSPAFRSLMAAGGPVAKTTEALAQHPGMTAFAEMLKERRPLAKAMVAAAEQAGAGKHFADMAKVSQPFSHGVAAELYQQQAGAAALSPLKALTQVVEREAPDFGQVAAAAIRNSAWAKTLEAPTLPADLLAMTKRPAFLDAAGLIEAISVRGSVVPIAEPQAPAEIEIAGAEIIELSPESLAEVSAGADARFNKQAAESLLVEEDLEHELGHLDNIAELLLRGDEQAQEYAALAASKILKGVANRVYPARDGYWRCRWNAKHPVGYENSANRIRAFLDGQLRAVLSTQEHGRLEATLSFVANWSGEGHHKAHAPEQSVLAYRDFLMILAYVARARRVERGH